MYVRTYVCMYACMYVCMHACMYMYLHTYTYVSVLKHPNLGQLAASSRASSPSVSDSEVEAVPRNLELQGVVFMG